MLKSIAKVFSARVTKQRPVKSGPCEGSTAGTTFVEILVAAAVFVSGGVAIMGSMVTLTSHRHVTDTRAAVSSFASSAFEGMRGMDITEILAYDIPVDNVQTNTVNLPGTGPVTVSLFALLTPAGDLNPTYFQLGVDDASLINIASLPNPIEIRAVLAPYHAGPYDYSPMQFSSATMIDY